MATRADSSLNLTAGMEMTVLTDELRVDSLAGVQARTTNASAYLEDGASVSAKGSIAMAATDVSVAAGSSVSVSGAGAVGVAANVTFYLIL